MPRARANWSGWQGVCLVAITYVYFLIFAQFAFLKRLALLGITDVHLKAVMAAMAIGGILFSLLAPRLTLCPSPPLRLRIGLAACGAAAALSLWPLGLVSSVAVSMLIGCGLGLLTVTLVTYLQLWLGGGNQLLKVGLGTGIGYLVCNIPPFFAASAHVQAVTSAVLCVAGICVTLAQAGPAPTEAVTPAVSTVSFLRVVACFTALVWLDSAAFFIIQNTPALKAGTWEGTIHLWINGLLHLVAALAGAWWLRRRGLSFVLSLSFFVIGGACLLLLDPSRAVLASAFYPVGVSLYSVALVAYPSLLAPVSSAAERGRQAGWIYAIAGWFGSAMGIGLGQNLGHVPPAFVLLTGVVVVLPAVLGLLFRRKREFALLAVILTSAFAIQRTINTTQSHKPQLSPAERGRQVYISEGCIHCHSQYVRPNTPDALMWGPARSVEELRREQPPLIGNRRQGPDLAEVGSRRSTLWLRAHFYNPPEVSHASFMPSYSHLFRDHRGEDLVAYLETLHTSPTDDQHLLAKRDWFPSSVAMAAATTTEGETLFRIYCATCHAEEGPTRRKWQTSFKRLPPGLRAGPFLHVPDSASLSERKDRLARIVKFGIAGTDMPGHEYLPDAEIASLALWLAQGQLNSIQHQH